MWLKTLTKFFSSKAIFFLIVFFTTARLYAQTIDSTCHEEKKIFVSGGVTLAQYSDAFFDYILDNAFSLSPALSYGYSVDRGNPSPSGFNHSKSSWGVTFSGGVDFTSLKNKNQHHIIEMSYSKFSGTSSSFADSYRKSAVLAERFYWTNIVDTIQIHALQTILSLDYKFQPEYKLFFFSAGINCSVNLIQINQRKQEQTDDWYYPVGFPVVHVGLTNTVSNTTSNVWFINVPLQLGAGRYVKIKKMVLKPAFYYSPCFMKGATFLYHSYNVSVDILYNK